jgi:uncharacterized membrane protein YeiH
VVRGLLVPLEVFGYCGLLASLEFLVLAVEYLDVLGGLGLFLLADCFGCLVLFEVLGFSVGIDVFGSPSFRICVRVNVAAMRGCLNVVAFKERKLILRGLLWVSGFMGFMGFITYLDPQFVQVDDC